MMKSCLSVAVLVLLSTPLGPLCADDLPAKSPRDPLTGPPHVTATAWAVADGETGRILWQANADKPAKSASITKVMCLLVVLELAEHEPGVLDEVLTYSELADNTGGSTSDINAGESLPVREVLYGLMLPSGNDAGNALAEHFNDRFDPPDYERTHPDRKEVVTLEKQPTRARFIAEMNRTASRLDLADTFYRLPYGDGGSAESFTTTPADLIKLARHVMRKPAFAKIVGTRRYSTKVRTPEGGERDVTWTNTNQLLGIEGFLGVKTGTTQSAGSCLLSMGRRGDDVLIVVVLGSSGNAARYVDSQNLYRFGWRERGHAGR